MVAAVTVRVPAKINLHLGVAALRPDGFHALDTVYQAISLYDDLTARPGRGVSLRGASYVDPASVPLDDTNIAVRALDVLGPRCGRRLEAEILIEKAIPVAGGMAGGSADAAAALLAADRLLDLGCSDATLLAAAAACGSDVPFALIGGTARGRGRGEQVTPVEDRGTWWWVVVPATGGLSTPAVYRRYDELVPDAPAVPAEPVELLTALASGDPHRLARALHNDLQPPALDLRPELGDLIERGEAEGALRGLVSGSGPTCLFLCESAEAARATAAGLQGGPRGEERVVLLAHGPVAGAHVVAR